MLSVQVDEVFAQRMDELISSSKEYSSRSEFLKDAIRRNIERLMLQSEGFRRIHEIGEEMRALAKSRGYDGSPISKEEKDATAMRLMREHKFKLR